MLDRIEQRSGCKWHIGLPTSFGNLGIYQATRSQRLFGRKSLPGLVISGTLEDPGALEQGMRSLRLHNVQHISDLKLSRLVDLSVLYFDGVMTEAPVIEGLVLPQILRFVVHYDGEVPRFKRMKGVGRKMFRWETKIGAREAVKDHRGQWSMRDITSTRHFELCHIDSIGSADTRSSSDFHSRRLKTRESSFSFLKRFHALNLSGVPWYAFHEMNLSSVRSLRLTVTESRGPVDAGMTVLGPNVIRFNLVIKADDAVLPRFTTPLAELMGIRISALNPNLTGLWQARCNIYPYAKMHISSDLGLPLRALTTGKRMYTVTAEEYQKMKCTAGVRTYAHEEPFDYIFGSIKPVGLPE